MSGDVFERAVVALERMAAAAERQAAAAEGALRCQRDAVGRSEAMQMVTMGDSEIYRQYLQMVSNGGQGDDGRG